MNDEARTQYVTREKILMLLSDGEVARVSSVEAKAHLLDGEEYLDLEDLDQGVRSALGTTTAPMGRVLPRKAVHVGTWNQILEQLAVFHPAKTPAGAQPVLPTAHAGCDYLPC